MSNQPSPLCALRRIAVVLAAAGCLAAVHSVTAQTTAISSLDISQMDQRRGEPRADRSAGNRPLTLAGQMFTNGIGTIAPSKLILRFWAGVNFTATVGVDDEVGKDNGRVVFKVLGDDDKLLWQSKEMRAGDAPQKIDVSVKGLKQLMLLAEGDLKGEHNHADWADAKITLHSKEHKDVRPNTLPAYQEEAVILTPKPGPQPRLTSAKIFGVRPGHPFIFTITATGERSMMFAAEGLPEGLKLDPLTGRISGSVKKLGEYSVTLHARNAKGEATRPLKIVCGWQLGLVPAMGWNSWNCYAHKITEEKIRSQADALVHSGLLNHGWSYVVTDEGWTANAGSSDPMLATPGRDANGRLLPNRNFSDMKGLADYIHSLGLRAGIYTSPGPCACGDYIGSYEHEELDAQRFAEWGFDYLKYDMCSYNKILAQRTKPNPGNALKAPMPLNSPEYLTELQRPWRIMRAELDKLDRDLIYSISGNTRIWGKEIGGNSWRTDSDIVDSWAEVVSGWEIPVSQLGFKIKNNKAYDYEHSNGAELSGPGYFNDRDMLVVGWVGWGNLHPTRLSPNEQYTHVSLWCLLTSPLMLGCDLTKLDDFTLSLLTNDEVLDVNQDPLARQAERVAKHGDLEVWAKDMEDGSKAVGLFNRGYLASDVTVNWSELGVTGKQRVRDLWRQKDLGEFSEKFTAAQVPRHGVLLVRVYPAK